MKLSKLQFVCLQSDDVEVAAEAALRLVINYWLYEFGAPEMVISVVGCNDNCHRKRTTEEDFQKMYALPIVEVRRHLSCTAGRLIIEAGKIFTYLTSLLNAYFFKETILYQLNLAAKKPIFEKPFYCEEQ